MGRKGAYEPFVVWGREREKSTYPPGGNKTDFLTRDGTTRDGGRLSNMLVVTTTVGMVDGVHRHTTSTGPAEQVKSSK